MTTRPSRKAIYGIIGFPLGHSLSPLMQNCAFQELGLNAEYKIFPLERDALPQFFADLRDPECDIQGFNVTVPYKEEVLVHMDNLTPLAQRINAVNTVEISGDRKLIAYNTDAPGFIAHLTELKVETAAKRICILGAGGSARAIIAALCLVPERPEWIQVYNRTASRLEALLSDLTRHLNLENVDPVSDLEDLNLELCDILINTTSLGLRSTDPCLLDSDRLHSGMFVYDIIYNPKETELLRAARSRGARTSNGLGMLYYQGVLALQHWTHQEINESVKRKMREKLNQGLNP